MGQLPGAGYAQDSELDERPAHDAGVGCFGLVAEFGFALLLSRISYHHLFSFDSPHGWRDGEGGWAKRTR